MEPWICLSAPKQHVYVPMIRLLVFTCSQWSSSFEIESPYNSISLLYWRTAGSVVFWVVQLNWLLILMYPSLKGTKDFFFFSFCYRHHSSTLKYKIKIFNWLESAVSGCFCIVTKEETEITILCFHMWLNSSHRHSFLIYGSTSADFFVLWFLTFLWLPVLHNLSL